MDKYSGCNIVESVVTRVQQEAPRVRPRRGTFLIRLIISAAIVGLILAVRYIPLSAFSSVKNALQSVFMYDFFGRSAFGGSLFLG